MLCLLIYLFTYCVHITMIISTYLSGFTNTDVTFLFRYKVYIVFDKVCILFLYWCIYSIIGLVSLATSRYQLIVWLFRWHMSIIGKHISCWPFWYMVACFLVYYSGSTWWYTFFFGSHLFEFSSKTVAWYYKCYKVVWSSDSYVFKGIIYNVYHLVSSYSFGYSLYGFLPKAYILFVVCFYLIGFYNDLFL